MAKPTFPARGQKGPNFWDDDLQRYIDYGTSLEVVNGGTVALPDYDEDAAQVPVLGYLVTAETNIGGRDYAPGVYVFYADPSIYGGWAAVLVEGDQVAPSPDSVNPVAGTLATSAVGETTVTVTVTGASDNTALHANPYRFSKDNGATYTAYQSSPVYNWTGLVSGNAYQMRHQVRDAGGNVSTGAAVAVTTTTPAGWSAYDSLTTALIGADRNVGPTEDFTTTGGHTYRFTSAYGSDILVASGLIKAPTDNGGVSGAFVSGAPSGYVAREVNYSGIGVNSGYFGNAQFNVGQATGTAKVVLVHDYTDSIKKLQIGSDYSADFTCVASGGYTLNGTGKAINGVPASGRIRIEPEGQLLRAYIDGTLVLTADFTGATYGGSPNPLTGTVTGAALSIQNGAALGDIEWETYVS